MTIKNKLLKSIDSLEMHDDWKDNFINVLIEVLNLQ